MKMHRYLQTFWDTNAGGTSYPKYEAGKDYPPSEETTRHVVLRYAKEVDVEEPAPATADAPAEAPAAEVAPEPAAEAPAPAPATTPKSKKA